MAVTSFEEVQEALEAIQTQLAELLAMINARPTRTELSDALAANDNTVNALRTEVSSLSDQVEILSRSVTSLGTTVAEHSH